MNGASLLHIGSLGTVDTPSYHSESDLYIFESILSLTIEQSIRQRQDVCS